MVKCITYCKKDNLKATLSKAQNFSNTVYLIQQLASSAIEGEMNAFQKRYSVQENILKF